MADTITIFQALGGSPACHKLARAFYARVERDPLLRPLFPGSTFTCAIGAFAAFLVQFLGGPQEDSQGRWWLSLRESHHRFRMGPEHREAWMRLMVEALDDAGIEEPARSALRGVFDGVSAYVVNRELPAAVMHPEMAHRWEAQRALDEAVAAVRSGDAERALALAKECGGGITAGLLALMIGSGQDALLDYVHERLSREAALTGQRYAGRTLLHAAAAAGRLATVELLLRLGADPNARDGGKHAPLYSVGNECRVAGAGDVVRALVRGGAQVNACEGVKRCTALHMAARRGNTEVAEALLGCGANIEARDSHGDTPLRRAVNCRQTNVVELLLARGADETALLAGGGRVAGRAKRSAQR
jgi:hemoglobin